MKAILSLCAAVLFWTIAATSNASAQCTEVFATGLKAPAKMIITPRGNILVSEAGDGEPNTGRISIIDPAGNRRTLVDGLPSGTNAVGEPSGPWGLALSGNMLYVTIGEGDVSIPGTAEGSAIANPSPSSPVFSSVLAIKLTSRVERKTAGFTLTSAQHAALAAGDRIVLKNRGKDKTTIERIVDFQDFVADPIPDEPGNIRTSNPFGIVADGDRLYIVDAALNSVVRVMLSTGAVNTLATFDPKPNPLPFGPPMVEAVPTNVRLEGTRLLVPCLTGFPFPGGLAEVLSVDLTTGTSSTLIGNRSTVIDVLPEGTETYLILEFSSDILAGTPGRLLRFASPGATPEVLADCLVTPANMTRNSDGDVFITELFAGQIVRVPRP